MWYTPRPPNAPSNLLIIFADLGVGAQHRIHRLEHVAHPRFADRALDHDNQFRLVGRRPHQTPAAILDRDANAIDGDEIADLLSRNLLSPVLHRLEMLHHAVDDAVFALVGAMP